MIINFYQNYHKIYLKFYTMMYYDITIEVGNDPHVKVFRAHMVILNYRSPYLRRILSTNNKKNDGTLAHIKLPNFLPETFHDILRFVLNHFSHFFKMKFKL